ncbi:MAG: OmpH family outer membrane protein [Elusimicrobia bacterium]|nr:OmpH family outer membrane protein [Candidatus Obscuribacterium magneticum]
MKYLKFAFLMCLICLILSTPLKAIEIPLEGSTKSGGAANIGYVDMERIFQIYPQTQYAKEDYSKKLKKMREDLTAKEGAIQNLQERISVLESTLKDFEKNTSTAGPAVPELDETNNIIKMKNDLESQKVEIEETKKAAVEELAAFERRQSQIILGKIYEALRELAEEEQITLVVDKSSILFGSASVDLTEKLQLRVRGY